MKLLYHYTGGIVTAAVAAAAAVVVAVVVLYMPCHYLSVVGVDQFLSFCFLLSVCC